MATDDILRQKVEERNAIRWARAARDDNQKRAMVKTKDQIKWNNDGANSTIGLLERGIRDESCVDEEEEGEVGVRARSRADRSVLENNQLRKEFD